MAVCDVVNEYGTLDDGLFPTVFSMAADAGALANAIAITLGMTIGVSGVLSDHVAQYGTTTVAEYGTLADSYDQAGNFENILDASGRLHDATKLAFQNTVLEHGTLAATAVESQPAGVLNDTGRLDDAVSPAILRMSFGDGARLSDAILSIKRATLTDFGRLADSTVQAMSLLGLIAERGTLSDAVASRANTADVLHEAMHGSETLVSMIHAANIAAEHATITDMVLTGVGGAWSSPLDTFAMSRWEQQPFNSIAEIDGVLYAASDDGLYRLGSQHEEQPIHAVIRGGLTDMDSPELKHASYFYAAYESEGTLAITVGYIPNGEEQSFTYAMPVRPATEPTSGRAKLGRGMRSRYWRFTLENVEGSDFTIFDQKLIVESTNRKV